MSKKNLAIALIMLVIGMFSGVAGYALATSATTPGTMISKIWNGGEINQNVALPIDSYTTTGDQSDNDPVLGDELTDIDEDEVIEELNQEIIADYKQNIGTFFTAWKSKDMTSFRAKLGKAYTGEIYERHAKQAEKFINQGVGLDTIQIIFENIDIESSSPNAATLNAIYHYQAQDYMVGDEHPIGEVYEHEVMVKVNMVKIGDHWYITGESPYVIED